MSIPAAQVSARPKTAPWRLRRLRRLPAYFFLGLWSVFTIVGLSYVILGAFKTQRELLRNPWDWPKTLNLANFEHAWNLAKLDIYLVNSIVVVVASVVVILTISAPVIFNAFCRPL